MADRTLLATLAPRTLELGRTLLAHPLFSRIPSVHGLLGLVYYASGAEEEAERAYARAAAIGKIDLLTVPITLGRSLLYIARGATRKARELLAHATPALRPVCDAHADALLGMFSAAAAAFAADFDAARATIAIVRERLAGSDEPELAALAGWIATLVDRLACGDDAATIAAELGAVVLPDRHRLTAVAQRLLVEGLRTRGPTGALHPARPPRSGPTLHLAADGGWFELDMARVDLSRRETLKRILLALVTRHRERPGTPLTIDDVITAGWPGERILPEAGRQRAYTALSSLRDMGLRDILLRRADGYLLDPVLFVAWTAG